jgi:hypothetical protein
VVELAGVCGGSSRGRCGSAATLLLLCCGLTLSDGRLPAACTVAGDTARGGTRSAWQPAGLTHPHRIPCPRRSSRR